MIDLRLTAARATLYSRAWFNPAYAEYVREHALDIDVLTRVVGATAVVPVVDCGNGRFDFGKIGLDPLGFVCETIGEDGESVVDLIAWPLTAAPANALSMFGRTGIVGLWEAFNPATYYLDKPLQMHRTPLGLLKAGGHGAAIADKRIAAYQFLDLPGRVAGQDQQHGRELLAIAEMVVDRSRFVAARGERVAA